MLIILQFATATRFPSDNTIAVLPLHCFVRRDLKAAVESGLGFLVESSENGIFKDYFAK